MTDKPDTRPVWRHKMTEKDVAWFNASITKITHHWEMTDVDKSRDWIELHREDKVKRSVPVDFFRKNSYFEFCPDHRSLVTPTYEGREAIKDLAAIDAWEKRHAAERAEYERLKEKFKS